MTSATYRELNKTAWQGPCCDNITKRYDKASNRRRGDDTPTRKQFEVEPSTSSAPAHPPAPAPCNNTAKETPPAVPLETVPMDARDPAAAAPGTQAITYDLFAKLLDSKLDHLRTTITAEFNQIFAELRESFREQVATLRSENLKLREEFSALERKVDSSDVAKMSEAISDLRNQLNDREQELLINDCDITGIPEHDGEPVGHLVMTLAAKLGMKLEERDVVSAVRVGPKRGLVVGAPAPNPRPIVVRLTRRSLRDELLQAARVRRGATTAELGLPPHEPRRFYVNERLTKSNRALFAMARDAGRAARWRFIWTRDGRVFARMENNSPRYVLRSEEDIKNFIKS